MEKLKATPVILKYISQYETCLRGLYVSTKQGFGLDVRLRSSNGTGHKGWIQVHPKRRRLSIHILCLWFHASMIYINNCPTRYNTKQSIYYSASSLYMFRVSTTPIIRGTQNCKYCLWYWSYFLCSYFPPTWPSLATLVGSSCTIPKAVVTVLCTPDDRCGWYPKHVEWTCRLINRLLCVTSRWAIINIAQYTYFHIKMTWLCETQDRNSTGMWLLVDWKTAVLFATGAKFLLCSLSGNFLRPSLTCIASLSSCPSER